MKHPHRHILTLLAPLALWPVCGEASSVVFSANYDATPHAQVVPTGGSTEARMTDDDGDVALSTGEAGYGGSGEGLVVCDSTRDIVAYRLDETFPGSDWFPGRGRFSIRYYIDPQSVPPAGTNLAMWELVYDAKPESAFASLGVTTQSGAARLFWRVKAFPETPEYGGIITESPDLTTDALAAGWHQVVFEFDVEGPLPPANDSAGVTAAVIASLDGEVGINRKGVPIGSPRTHSELRVGTTLTDGPGLDSLGSFGPGNLYDDMTIHVLDTDAGVDDAVDEMPEPMSAPMYLHRSSLPDSPSATRPIADRPSNH